MEDVLAVYHRPHDPQRPVVCLDECGEQLIGEVRTPLPPRPARDDRPGQAERYDYEYMRNGTANLFMAFEPLGGWREVAVTEPRRREDWARFVRDLGGRALRADRQARPGHGPAQHPLPGLALRGVRARGGQAPRRPARDPPHPQARLLAQYGRDRVQRPRQVDLPNRVGDRATLERHVQAWQHRRNAAATKADWQFTTKHARMKLPQTLPDNGGLNPPRSNSLPGTGRRLNCTLPAGPNINLL